MPNKKKKKVDCCFCALMYKASLPGFWILDSWKEWSVIGGKKKAWKCVIEPQSTVATCRLRTGQNTSQ